MLADFLATEQHRAIAAFLTGLPCSRSVRRLLVVIIAAASPAILYVAWHSLEFGKIDTEGICPLGSFKLSF